VGFPVNSKHVPNSELEHHTYSNKSFLLALDTVTEDGSPEFNRFIDLLGDTIQLKGWDKYKAGLDIKGMYTAIVTDWENIVIELILLDVQLIIACSCFESDL
jgi:hypothetical protein